MKKNFLLFSIIFGFLIFPLGARGEALLISDTETFEKAQVIEILNQSTSTIPGTEIKTQTQTLKIKILEGDNAGKIVTFKNDHIQLSVGDKLYTRHQTNHLDNTEYFTVSDPYRLDSLFFLVIVFIALIFIFGGIQGVRGLASLLGSLVLIFYLLIPGIYEGSNAVLVSIGVASLIIVIGSYITHGFNKTTTSAVLGMLVTVIITGMGAYFTVSGAHLTGYSSEESMYLSFNTQGSIDMVGLLFGGIMIGLLGVLYDIAIGQAVAVEELFRAGTHMTRAQIYKRGIRIGREHIGALVNTLAIAYVGASLPLFLLIKNSTAEILYIINSEIFSTEIVRILIGSIGLILAVPITTLIASFLLEKSTHIKRDEGSSHRHSH